MALAATLSLILVKASVGASLHIEDFRFVETSRGDIVEPSAKITFLSEDIFKGTRNTKGYQSFFQIKNIGTFFGFGFKGDWAEFNFLARGHLMDKLPTNKQAEEARNHLPPRPSSGFVGSVSSLPLGAKIGISIIFALLATSVLGLAGWLSYVNLRRGIALASISGCLFALSGVFAWLASPY